MNILEARRRTLGKGVYKKTVEGNPAIAQGSLARMYPGITMQGWTEQAQYEGNQLLPLPVGKVIESKSGNNTLTVTESGVNLNFTKSTPGGYTNDIYVFGNAQYNIEAGYEDASAYIPQGLYILITDIVSSNVEVFIAVWRKGVKVDLVTSATPKPANFALLEGDKIRIGLRPKNTLDISNATLMVIKQTLPSTTPYEPYTGGQPSPSPEYPQKIVSAGKYNEETGKWDYEVKLTGKNMLPRYDSPSGWMPGGYFYIPIHGFIVGETYTASQQNPPEAGENFYVSIRTCAGNANAGAQHWLYHKSGGNLTKKSVSFKATQEVYYLNVADISSNGVTIDSAKLDKFLELFPDLMLEIGSEPTEYTPYQEQAVTLTADRPLTKWDKLEKRNGQWGWVYKSAEIESYTDESVPGEYFSTTGQLSTGAQVWYETTTETFVPLSESEQEAMSAFEMYLPTTVITNDVDCSMIVTYKST